MTKHNGILALTRMYENHGVTALIDAVNVYNNTNDYPIPFEYCKGCEADMPSWEHDCIACGQTTKPKVEFFQAVLKRVADPIKHIGGGATLEQRLGDACCPDCGGAKWYFLPTKSIAVQQGGKPYIECLGCGYSTHL